MKKIYAFRSVGVFSICLWLCFLFWGFSGMFKFALAGNNAGAAFSVWPDTGQEKCYNNEKEIPCPASGEPFYGQDAQYQGPERSYTKLGYGGVELSDSATFADGWIMTRDNVTGLVWEIKTDDGSIHDKDNKYTWCDTNPDTNGGYEGDCDLNANMEDFISSFNFTNFGGYNDWRVPTIKELASLINYNIVGPGPKINTFFFPYTITGDGGYWSSTTAAKTNYGAWVVFFSRGVFAYYVKSENFSRHIFVVRGGKQREVNSHFIDNHDGTITDQTTGLMWQKCSMGQQWNNVTGACDGQAHANTWQGALQECEELSLAGYDDWRLPDTNDLLSIMDFSREEPCIDTTYFPHTESANYMPSTPVSGCNECVPSVYFRYGGTDYGYKTTEKYVRAVRGQANISKSHVISGSFSRYGQPLADVDISLTEDNSTQHFITGADGTFRFANLPTGTYHLIPSLEDHVFNPESIEVTLTDSDVTGLDIIAVTIADGDEDADVDGSDLYEFVHLLSVNGYNTAFDLNHNDGIDAEDLRLFAETFGNDW